MKNVTSLAIDIAKNVFQLHGTDRTGRAILKMRVQRTKLSEIIANMPPCKIYMEACATSNYWGREFTKLGHSVKLINPKYVTPYVKRNKNDKNDAAGIAAASRDPDMRFCEVKTEDQQDMQSIHRIRRLLIGQRTAIANQLRGILAEYGEAIPKGINQIDKHMPKILGDNPKNMGALILNSLQTLYDIFKNLGKQIAVYDRTIEAIFKENETCQKLASIPGVGKISATILAAVLGTGGAFKNGRHFAAFLGLVPRQHSSGNKERLLGISKGGDTYIRTLLTHGGRAVILWSNKKTDRVNIWVKNLVSRRGKNKAAIALANKIARTAWAIVHENTTFTLNHKPKINSPARSIGS